MLLYIFKYHAGDDDEDYWIGAKRSTVGGPFVQTFASPIINSSPLWKSGQPSSSSANYCAKAKHNNNFELDDKACSELHFIVCQIAQSNTWIAKIKMVRSSLICSSSLTGGQSTTNLSYCSYTSLSKYLIRVHILRKGIV